YEVVQLGQIGPRGGLNFDSKPRRSSFEPNDLFYGHIVGMDSFAAGLRVALKLKEDKVLENLVSDRYSSYNSGIGAQIEAGKVNFKDMEDYIIDKTQAELRAATHSDHLEQIKDTINHYIVETLSK
ncbi:xylose isomerase, partial [Lactobacillus sp. XV13L]|nr:xylose isomerase [Lactobacillus sp. XV13L]